MDRKQQLLHFMKTHSIYDTLDKYSDVNDLYIILELELEKGNYYYITDILQKFPATGEYDRLLIDTLDKCSYKLDDYEIYKLIWLIFDDNLKLQTLSRYIDILTNINVAEIINSLKSDELRKEKFSEYIDIYDVDEFSDYIRKIRSDELRYSEFLLYKEQFPSFRLDWIAGSFKTDDKKIEIFVKYFDGSHKKQLSYFIRRLASEEAVLKFFDKFKDFFEDDDISCLCSDIKIKSDEGILHIINQLQDKIQDNALKELLLKINDENTLLKMLDILSYKLSPASLMKIIMHFKNQDKRIELFDKYIDLFGYDQLRCMLVEVDETRGNEVLDKYIDYFDGLLLAEIWRLDYCFRGITIKGDDFLSKYIDKINVRGFVSMRYKLIAQYNGLDGAIQHIQSITTDKKAIRRFYNAIAFTDKEYFLNNLYNSDVFTSEERCICDELSNGNPHFYSYFLFDLFDIPLLKNNRYFLSKFAKYPETSQKIINLYKRRPDLINLFLLISRKICNYDINYDSMISCILPVFFEDNHFLTNIDIKQLDENRKLVLLYRLLNQSSNDPLLIDVAIDNNNDLDTYQERVNNEINKLYLSCQEIEQKKNLVFNKIFGFSINKAQELLDCYGFSIDKFNNEPPISYIKIIKEILIENNIDNIDNYYYNLPVLNIEERILLDQELKKVFNRRIKDSLYKVSEHEPHTVILSNNISIPVYIPDGDFYLMVNSLVAYNKLSAITDYDAFWNCNPNTKNHGICCSLISNQNIAQTAPINDVVVGFDDFMDSAIQLADSNDISSVNDKFSLSSFKKNRFMTPQDYIDETRHTHNELVLERAELRKNIKAVNLKPSYVVVYSFSDDESLNKSFKAAAELNVPIVYLNVEEIALRENMIISNYLKEVQENLDIDTFKSYLVRYINNIYGLSNDCPNIVKMYFEETKLKNSIESILLNIIETYQNNLIDEEKALDLLKQIQMILEQEQAKISASSNALVKVDLISHIDMVKDYICQLSQKKETFTK